jgi:hypothetical protein
LALGRLQFGVELALERLQGARTDYDSVVDPMSAEGIEAGFRVSSEIHALFVVADSFWDNLAEVVKDLPGVRGIADARSAGADIADRTRMGRDHLEHFAERIPKGRRGRPKDPDMSAAVFAQIPGGFDGRMALFGDEEFDVVVIAEAVTRAGSTARAALGHSIGRHVFESR